MAKRSKLVPYGGVPGFYVSEESGIFYTRYSVNGRRSWHSHRTTDHRRAKILHAEKLGEIERDRQRGSMENANFSTLGGLEHALVRIWEEDLSQTDTKSARKDSLRRLKLGWEHCQFGKWETYPARQVSHDRIVSLRNALARSVKWKRRECHKTWTHGYSNPATNYALRVLHQLLSIAKHKRAIPENPFEDKMPGRESLYMPAETRKVITLPTIADMERVFEELENPSHGYSKVAPDLAAHLRTVAKATGRFARLLAYSGMRVGELAGQKRRNAEGKLELVPGSQATVADDLGTHFHVRGTKTKTSDRKIPVNRALRQVLDEIKQDRIAGPLVDIEDINPALKRACKAVGVPTLSHHDLRHYFATICIEQKTDIPTVSRWLGHADGGALAMKTYGHLRNEHSVAAMALVNFGERGAVQLKRA